MVTPKRRKEKWPKSTADDIAQVLKKDPVICLRLISVANSPVCRGVSEIKSVKGALPRLGLKETLNVVLAIANKSLYSTDKVQFRSLAEFINVIAHHDDKELSDETETEILVIHLANMLTRKIGFSLFDGDFEFIELDTIRILKMEPKVVADIGENIRQTISDVAHLF